MRFSIRDLIWLTIVASVCAGWWLNHRYQTADPHPMAELWRWRVDAIGEIIGEKIGWWVAWTDDELTVYDGENNEVKTIKTPRDERFPGMCP